MYGRSHRCCQWKNTEIHRKRKGKLPENMYFHFQRSGHAFGFEKAKYKLKGIPGPRFRVPDSTRTACERAIGVTGSRKTWNGFGNPRYAPIKRCIHWRPSAATWRFFTDIIIKNAPQTVLDLNRSQEAQRSKCRKARYGHLNQTNVNPQGHRALEIPRQYRTKSPLHVGWPLFDDVIREKGENADNNFCPQSRGSPRRQRFPMSIPWRNKIRASFQAEYILPGAKCS